MRLLIISCILVAGCAAETPAPQAPTRQVTSDGYLIDMDGCILDQNGERLPSDSVGCRQYHGQQ